MSILLVEDDIKIASAIVEGLKQNNFECVHHLNAEAAMADALVKPYQLIIADLMLPEMDGLSMIAGLREKKVKTPVLILSAKRSLDDRVLGLQKGGDDYMVKPFAFVELLARVQNLIRLTSQSLSTPTELQFHDIKINLVSRETFRENQKIELQTKEFLLLEYFMKHPNTPLTKVQILEEIWGYNFDPQTNVVDVLVYRLRNKIDKGFAKTYLQTIRGIGYVFRLE